MHIKRLAETLKWCFSLSPQLLAIMGEQYHAQPKISLMYVIFLIQMCYFLPTVKSCQLYYQQTIDGDVSFPMDIYT